MSRKRKDLKNKQDLADDSITTYPEKVDPPPSKNPMKDLDETPRSARFCCCLKYEHGVLLIGVIDLIGLCVFIGMLIYVKSLVS